VFYSNQHDVKGILTCLLAKIKSTASLNSSSASILINSSLASPILSLSLLSTTKIKPCKNMDMSVKKSGTK
jgi:hypothetical protein